MYSNFNWFISKKHLQQLRRKGGPHTKNDRSTLIRAYDSSLWLERRRIEIGLRVLLPSRKRFSFIIWYLGLYTYLHTVRKKIIMWSRNNFTNTTGRSEISNSQNSENFLNIFCCHQVNHSLPVKDLQLVKTGVKIRLFL